MMPMEMLGPTSALFDAEFIQHAADAVFHYFKHELQRQTVTLGEFSVALEKVLGGFALTARATRQPAPAAEVLVSDLCRLAQEAEGSCELLFFPRLRDELHHQILQGLKVLRFRRLRDCVKQLAGARRWSPRCQGLKEQIVSYMRQCLIAESNPVEFSLIVE
jgi:hypothetical protein